MRVSTIVKIAVPLFFWDDVSIRSYLTMVLTAEHTRMNNKSAPCTDFISPSLEQSTFPSYNCYQNSVML